MASTIRTLINGVQNVDELKERVEHANLSYKEDDDFMIVYSKTNDRSDSEIDNVTKSVIIDKAQLQQLTTQFNKPIYNSETETFLTDKDWNKVSVQMCYEGTLIVVFYEKGKWYICTRKCLDATKSAWIKGLSYYDLFMEAIDGKFKLDDLNKSFCYHFVLIHHKNRNIVDYTSMFGNYYRKIAHVMTLEKYTNKRVEYIINDKVLYPQRVQCSSIETLKRSLSDISEHDEQNRSITTEGFIIEYDDGTDTTLLKLQTHIYTRIASIKPNTNNLDAMFLELYQRNELAEIVPYFSKQVGEVINRIHSSMKAISGELLNIYHATRCHMNEKLYDDLPSSYKCVLYTIHGVYINKRTREIERNKTSELGDKKSITIHDVYECLKSVDSYTLRKLFIDRLTLIEHDDVREYIDVECFDAIIQGKLMM